MSPTTGKAKPRKAERTRRRILETALRLFRKRGYDGTTMRAVADEAGVSLGNAYYYFKSKEHLIQEYYSRSQTEHMVACVDLLETETDLKKRLLGVFRAKIEVSQPYHRFAGQLFKTAADPASPLSPFSADSLPVRREATELLALVVEGSTTRVGEELAAELPNLLWLYLCGVILFWIHDGSADCARTYRLIDRTIDIVVRLITLSSFPPFRPLVVSALALSRELREIPGATAESEESPA